MARNADCTSFRNLRITERASEESFTEYIYVCLAVYFWTACIRRVNDTDGSVNEWITFWGEAQCQTFILDGVQTSKKCTSTLYPTLKHPHRTLSGIQNSKNTREFSLMPARQKKIFRQLNSNTTRSICVVHYLEALYPKNISSGPPSILFSNLRDERYSASEPSCRHFSMDCVFITP